MKKNTQLLITFMHTLKHAFVSMRHIDLVVTHRVYKTHHKFMCFAWDTFEVKKTVPYIEDPLYDGDYATNRQLGVISKMLDAKSDEFLMNVSKCH